MVCGPSRKSRSATASWTAHGAARPGDRRISEPGVRCSFASPGAMGTPCSSPRGSASASSPMTSPSDGSQARELAGQLTVGVRTWPSCEFRRPTGNVYDYVRGLVVAEGFAVDRSRDADGRVRIHMCDVEPLDVAHGWAIANDLNVSRGKREAGNPRHRDQHILTFSRHDGLLEAGQPLSRDKHVPSDVIAEQARVGAVPCRLLRRGRLRPQALPRDRLRQHQRGAGAADLRHARRSGACTGTTGSAAVAPGIAFSRASRSPDEMLRILPGCCCPGCGSGTRTTACSESPSLATSTGASRATTACRAARSWRSSRLHTRAVAGSAIRMVRRSAPRCRRATDRKCATARTAMVSRSLTAPSRWSGRCETAGLAKLRRLGSPLARSARRVGRRFLLAGHFGRGGARLTSLRHPGRQSRSTPSSPRAMSFTTAWVSTTRTATRAIYDAMVRLAQDFSLNVPLIDGHGNFGSPDDGPAASRYTEARMSREAMLLVGELGEDTVDFEPNYDGSLSEPTVLPAAFPNLLVNGTSGIAVGMATNMIPHNLGEVVAAARWLINHPDADAGQADGVRPRPRPAHRRAAARPRRGAPGVRDRPRRGADARPGRDRPARGQPRPAGDHRDRAALRRRRGEGHRGDHRRGHQDQAAAPASPTSRTSPTGRTAPGWSSSARSASTRRRCSPTSTGSPRWSSPSASTTWSWSTGSRRPSGSRRCWRCSWRTATRW